jgi:hypothetical protein
MPAGEIRDSIDAIIIEAGVTDPGYSGLQREISSAGISYFDSIGR